MDTVVAFIEGAIGFAVLLLMVGLAIGWIGNLFMGGGGTNSDFDTKDPGDYF